MKRWMLYCSAWLLLSTGVSCTLTARTVADPPQPPADTVVVKRATLDRLIEEIINTKRELMECLGK